MQSDLSILYEPYELEGLELKNRLVMAPMHTKFASESGEVTERMIGYLAERARGGADRAGEHLHRLGLRAGGGQPGDHPRRPVPPSGGIRRRWPPRW